MLSAALLAGVGTAAIVTAEPASAKTTKTMKSKRAVKRIDTSRKRGVTAAKRLNDVKVAGKVTAEQCDSAFFAATGSAAKYTTIPSGLKYYVVREGSGKQPTATDNVTVHYTGRLLNGTVFDSSVERGEPLEFPLDRVIKGWTEGVQLMKEGEKAVFYIPSELAYGKRGTPGGPIPPNAPLIFEIELIKIND